MKWTFLALAACCLVATTLSAQKPFNGNFIAISPVSGGEIYLKLINNNGVITGRYSEPDNAEADYTISGRTDRLVLRGRMTSDQIPLLSFAFTCRIVKEGIYFTLDNRFWASLVPPVTFVQVKGKEENEKRQYQQ